MFFFAHHRNQLIHNSARHTGKLMFSLLTYQSLLFISKPKTVVAYEHILDTRELMNLLESQLRLGLCGSNQAFDKRNCGNFECRTARQATTDRDIGHHNCIEARHRLAIAVDYTFYVVRPSGNMG